MKKMTLKLLLLGLLTLSVSNACTSLERAGNTFDFGKVIAGQKVEHTFIITNKKEEVMTISRVKSFCGCTAVVTAERKILPGRSTNIKVSLKTWDLRGKVDKKIEVFLDKEKDPLILSLQGEVKKKPIPQTAPRLTLSQRYIDLGTMRAGEVKTFNLLIQNKGNENLYIRNFKVGREKDALTLDKHPISPGKRVEASFSYSATQAGPIEDHLLIVSNDPANPNLFLPIRGEVKEAIQKRMTNRHPPTLSN